jgi:integrase
VDRLRGVLPVVGRVEAVDRSPWWAVVFPDEVHEPCREWLRDLAACDCSALTIRSYAFDLLRWLRFLQVIGTGWVMAGREQVRDFVEYLREAPNPQQLRRSPDAPALGSVNKVTCKPYPRPGYAARTINHQLSVLSAFYAFAVDADLGPLVNPVPAQRGRGGGRPHAHHSPMEPFAAARRAAYRQVVPRAVPRGIPDGAVEALFGALTSNRDRALISFYLSSGARASELLGLRREHVDAGRRTIKVVSKGSRALEEIPASPDAFVWLALYLAEGGPADDGVVWRTLRPPRRPLTYHAMRAALMRANTALGANYSLHDLRHTAASRMAADPAFTLVDVQAILRHAKITTTQAYLVPRLDDLVAKVAEHYARPRPPARPDVSEGYDQAQVRELLGLGL